MREPDHRDHHHPARLIRGLLVALAALVAACPAAAGSFASLPSPVAPLSPAPPLGGGATAGAENVRHRVQARLRVEVGVDRTGAPFRIVATQRLDVRVLGDYYFTIGAPVIGVTEGSGSESLPGARATSIVWAGFDPGRRILSARAKLDAAAAAPSLPLRISVAGGRTILTNVTAVDAGAFSADATRAPLLAFLAELRRTVRHGLLPVGGAATVLTKPVPARFRVVAPLRVEGTIGGRRVSLVLRGRATVPGTGRIRLSVTPDDRIEPRDVTRLDGRALLAYVTRVSLTIARVRQYQAFLGNPDPTGHSETTYVYRTAARASAVPAPAHRGGSGWTTALLAALAAAALLGAAVVVWARS